MSKLQVVHVHRGKRPATSSALLFLGYRDFAALDERLRFRRLAAKVRYRVSGVEPMQVLVTGSKGLVGSAIVLSLTTGGHEVTRLVRSPPGAGEVRWDPANSKLDPTQLPALDAIVHLAGDNISEGRWTEEKKRRILKSRVHGTRLIAETLAGMKRQPRVLVCASAIGFYGDRGREVLDEGAGPGSGFLSEVCRQWEKAAQPAREAGIRVVHLRFGVVLSAEGGALAKMLLPFRLGAGGVLGNGEQYMSWISLDDAIGVIHFALTHDSLQGPVNAVAPHPVTNREYTKILGKVLARPTIIPMPAFAARLAFGEMAEELLLSSTRVEPRALRDAGYSFRFPKLEKALRHLLSV